MFKKSVEKIQVIKTDRIMGNLYEEQCTFLIISRSVLLRMRNISDRFVGKIKTRSLFSNFFFLELCPVWDNVVLYFRSRRATDGNMAHVHCGWIHKTTNTLSKYVILIDLPCQQWLQDCPSLLRCSYIACPVPLTYITSQGYRQFSRKDYQLSVLKTMLSSPILFGSFVWLLPKFV